MVEDIIVVVIVSDKTTRVVSAAASVKSLYKENRIIKTVTSIQCCNFSIRCV